MMHVNGGQITIIPWVIQNEQGSYIIYHGEILFIHYHWNNKYISNIHKSIYQFMNLKKLHTKKCIHLYINNKNIHMNCTP